MEYSHRIAGMNEHFIRMSLNSFFDCMEKNMIKDIELWAGLPHLYAFDMDIYKVNQIKREIYQRGLNLICYTPEQCVYPFNMAAREPDLKDWTLKYYRKNIEIASDLGSPMFQIVPGWGYRNEPVSEAMKRSLEAIENVTRYAERFGIRVVIEALEPFESNLVNTANGIRRILDELSLVNLGAIVDTCPMAVAGETITNSFEMLGDRLWHFHFIDSNHMVWGDGDLPLKHYLSDLEANHYEGYLSIEILNERYVRNPKEAFRKALGAIQQSIKEC